MTNYRRIKVAVLVVLSFTAGLAVAQATGSDHPATDRFHDLAALGLGCYCLGC